MRALLISIGVFFLCASSFAQEVVKSFRPIISVGAVASQIDGDTYSGFHKLGYFFGIGINRQFSKMVEAEFGITFLQKGVRHNYKTDSASLNNPDNAFSLIRLNYAEIPVSVGINYKRFRFDFGGYYAYLIKNPPYDESQYGTVVDNNFKNTDKGWLIGLGYKLKPSLLVNLRYQYSFVPIRDYYQSTNGIYHGLFFPSLFNRGLYNNYLVLSLNYKIPPKTPAPVGAQ